MKYTSVIFDLDDTIFDRNAAQIRAVELFVKKLPDVFHAHSTQIIVEAFLDSDRKSVEDYEAGISNDNLRENRSRYFLETLGIEQEHRDTITEIYLQDYPRVNIPVTGAVPLVKELSKTLPVAIISNGLPDVQYKKIEAIGLKGVFTCIVLSEEIGIRKPDSRIFHHTTDLLKVQPSDCLFVGDSFAHDIVGAKAAGMQACWYNSESSESENHGVQPDFVISYLAQLNEILGL